MTKPAPPAEALPFDPTLPHALPLPWPGAWGQCAVVYDLYKCEAFQDDQAAYMAGEKAAARRIDGLLRAFHAVPEGVAHEDARADAWDAWKSAYAPFRRANCLRQIAYFVVALRLPDGRELPGSDATTWAGFPLKLLEWVADDGYALARAELWDPKLPTPSMPPATSEPAAAR